jgi:hypothetical protein
MDLKRGYYNVIEKENVTGKERIVLTARTRSEARKLMHEYENRFSDYYKKQYHIYIKAVDLYHL